MSFTNKHSFIHEATTRTVTVVSEAETLPDIVEAFEDYLRACGFIFDGHLDIIEEDEEAV